ncbi:acyl-CoA dehydrogenase family protein [Amycolatopsis alkalitolerans]|uniref:Acyl-CoA dehydrogenase n=1 Tax=Amycolatopsis alkalitolerans TaxID=2547244 RepID=A0A5C4MD48_9PSEU|nr:acyl-CoA dehydrogenase family protein [Amycolatopsis alkalitolerans]TNC29463.1 acyl-CoA dehydrogenase [Amycolatopsis alkalitolerans]
MTIATAALDIDRDPQAYLALHQALDESAADALLDERERTVRAAVRDVVAHEVAPRAAAADRDHVFVHESYQALAKAGLAGLIFPERLGGTGDTHTAYAAAMEEISAGCAATALVYMTQMHAAYPIMIAGSDELAGRYIPGLLCGETYGALGITEPNAGSDVASLRTVATPHPDGYRLSGAKTFITTGDKADVIICFATIDRSLGRDGVTAFVLDGRWPGLSRGTPLAKLGMHGSTTAELFFDEVEVPANHLLGKPGGGWRVVLNSVIKSRISAAAQGVGIARAAYARTLRALTRLHGSRLPDEQAFALATLRGQVLQGRLLLFSVARQVDRSGTPSAGQIGMMKQSCTDLGWHAAREAMRILGPYGDLAELGVERCLRDAKVTQIYDGTNEVQRLLIARDTARTLGGLR